LTAVISQGKKALAAGAHSAGKKSALHYARVLQKELMSKMADAIYQTGGVNYTYGTSPELLCKLFTEF